MKGVNLCNACNRFMTRYVCYRRVGEDRMFMITVGTFSMLFSTKNEDGSRSYLKLLGFVSMGLFIVTALMGLKPTYEVEGPIRMFDMEFLEVYLFLGAFYAIYGFWVSYIDRCYSVPRILFSPTFWAGSILLPVFWLDQAGKYYGFFDMGYTIGFICLFFSLTRFLVIHARWYGAIFMMLLTVTLLLKMAEGNFPWYEELFGQMFSVSLIVFAVYTIFALLIALKHLFF